LAGESPLTKLLVMVGPKPRIPAELKLRPFSLQEARAAGISRTSLSGRSWRRLGAQLYCWTGLADDPWKLLSGWMRILPEDADFAGATAAWLHGIDLDFVQPVEVVAGSRSGLRSRPGLTVRRSDVARSDAVKVRGLPATSVTRTLVDICARRSPVEALVAMDVALRRRLIDKATLCRLGTRRMRCLAELAEPAESPMETRLRWLLRQAGLPRPEVQRDLHDGAGRVVGRADIYYAVARLVVEYDGGNHRDRMVDDDRRQNLISNAGFHVLRYTAADVYGRPDVVATQVRAALVQR
jgi:very-short-patch-repair endonuclease